MRLVDRLCFGQFLQRNTNPAHLGENRLKPGVVHFYDTVLKPDFEARMSSTTSL